MPTETIMRTCECGAELARYKRKCSDCNPDKPVIDRAVTKGCLYVVEFSNFVVKVGKSFVPDQRIKDYIVTGDVHGNPVTRVCVTDPFVGYELAEQELIRKAGSFQPVHGLEYFQAATAPKYRCFDRLADFAEGLAAGE